jgi:hypothetical protein
MPDYAMNFEICMTLAATIPPMKVLAVPVITIILPAENKSPRFHIDRAPFQRPY